MTVTGSCVSRRYRFLFATFVFTFQLALRVRPPAGETLTFPLQAHRKRTAGGDVYCVGPKLVLPTNKQQSVCQRRSGLRALPGFLHNRNICTYESLRRGVSHSCMPARLAACLKGLLECLDDRRIRGDGGAVSIDLILKTGDLRVGDVERLLGDGANRGAAAEIAAERG